MFVQLVLCTHTCTAWLNTFVMHMNVGTHSGVQRCTYIHTHTYTRDIPQIAYCLVDLAFFHDKADATRTHEIALEIMQKCYGRGSLREARLATRMAQFKDPESTFVGDSVHMRICACLYLRDVLCLCVRAWFLCVRRCRSMTENDE